MQGASDAIGQVMTAPANESPGVGVPEMNGKASDSSQATRHFVWSCCRPLEPQRGLLEMQKGPSKPITLPRSGGIVLVLELHQNKIEPDQDLTTVNAAEDESPLPAQAGCCIVGKTCPNPPSGSGSVRRGAADGRAGREQRGLDVFLLVRPFASPGQE